MMPSKYNLMVEMSELTAKKISSSPGKYMEFLYTAANNYKYSFDDQLLIFAQKPDATACAEIEVWNRLGRWINKGTVAITLLRETHSYYKLRHVFDISDTNSREGFAVKLWKCDEEYKDAVLIALENSFGDISDKTNFSRAIISIAETVVQDNYSDYLEQLTEVLDDSYLEALDSDNIRKEFRNLLIDSVAFQVLSRCGYDAFSLFDSDEFTNVTDFNTLNALYVLGSASSDISEMVLREIEATVKDAEKQKTEKRIFAEKNIKADNATEKDNTEGRKAYETDLQTGRGLLLSEPESARSAENRQVWNIAARLPEKEQTGNLRRDDAVGDLEQSSGDDRPRSESDGGTPDKRDGESRGSERRDEEDRPVEVGGNDELAQSFGGGDSPSGTRLQLSGHDFNARNEIDYFYDPDGKNELLRNCTALKNHRKEIAAFFESTDDNKERGNFIKGFFNNTFVEHILESDERVGYRAYDDLLHIWHGSYLSRDKEDYMPWWRVAGAIQGQILLDTWLLDDEKDIFTESGQIALIDDIKKAEKDEFSIPQAAIDYVLTGGSGIQDGKFRIYEEFVAQKSAEENIRFLKEEYGIGGRSDPIPESGFWEDHDGKGIRLRKGNVQLNIPWNKVAKRIGELIAADRYLNSYEKAAYPAYRQEEENRQKRGAIAEQINSLVEDFNDFQTQIKGDTIIEKYKVREYTSSFMLGERVIHGYGNYPDEYVLPSLRDILNRIISENTHLTERAKALLTELDGDIAKSFELSDAEKNPPPEPKREHRFSLGDNVYIGTDVYEILSLDDPVVLFDPKFPLITTEIPKGEFLEKVKENPLNDNHLRIVEEQDDFDKTNLEAERAIDEHEAEFGADGTRVFREVPSYLTVHDLARQLVDFKKEYDFYDYQDVLEISETDEDAVSEMERVLQSKDETAQLITALTEGRDNSSKHADRRLWDELLYKVTKYQAEALSEIESEKLPVYDRSVEILYDVFYALKIDDISLDFEDGDIIAFDKENRWKGKELFRFIIDDCFVFEDDGTVAGIGDELLSDFIELSEHFGVPVIDNRYRLPYREYLYAKAENPDAVILYRMGDFFEIMGEEAPGIAETLAIQITSRDVGLDKRISMCGFPFHKSEAYIDMLRDRGYDIVLFEDGKGERLNSSYRNEPHDSFPVARIDYYDDNGQVEMDTYYTDEGSFLRDLSLENKQGTKMSVALYRDENGRTISEVFTEWLKEPKPEIKIEDWNYTRRIPEAEKPVVESSEQIEFTDSLAPPPQKKKRDLSPHILYPEIKSDYRTNFKIENDDIGVGTPLERFRHNIMAIQLLHKLEDEHRLADSNEQRILSDYVGWGGLAEFFEETNPHYNELCAVLNSEELSSARESTLTAFYTPPVVIKSIYKALENMGFKEGNILEPSCGIGNFMGLIPDSMINSRIYGVELDSISGRIAQQLYQKNNIAVQGFENTDLPDSFFDAALGNVPFGNFKLSDKKYDKNNFLVHDYFFAKTLDKVRPGGIVAFITSHGTMDKENPAVRKYIAQRADLLGAIRLPNNTFKDAAGTEVTADIIFLQKRDRLIDIEPDWVHLNTDENGITMNQYFIDNPDMIVGEMKTVSGPFGPEAACIAYEDQTLSNGLYAAIQNIHAQITEYDIDELIDEGEDKSIPADPNVKNFSYTVVDGKVYYRVNSRMNLTDVSVTAENRIKGMIKLRDCVRELIEYQMEDYPDEMISAKQKELNELYDNFNKKYGRINSRANNSAFSQDNSYFLLTSLEKIDDEGNFVEKADMFTKRTIRQKVIVTSVDTASEALALSLAEKTKVDMPYMCELTGKTEEEIADELRGVIFLNPLFGYGSGNEPKYLPADEYLSGNIREKLTWAKKSAELYPGDYSVNVEALTQVMPEDLSAAEISVRLGATWIPPDDINEFMWGLFDTPWYQHRNIAVSFAQFTGEWNISGKSYDRGNVKVFSTYGTERRNGYQILEDTLNLRDVRIFDYIEDEFGKKTAVLNKKETAIAQGKQQLIKEAFAEWIWKDPDRRERLTKMYNEKFNSTRPREYDGSHLNFVGMNPEIILRPHQVNAIAHILYGGNTLLAHVVGAGKTFEMVAAAQESKRLGLCHKSLFVVPNHLTEQWASEYLQLYPAANILVATKKDFETKNRKRFCGRIATGDYDAVIIGHSQFEKIPMSTERQITLLEKQKREILEGIEELKRNRGERFSIKQMEKARKAINQKLEKLNDQSRKDDVVTFEELGVDRLFIDEAHYYKNLAAFTKMRNVGGISQTEAMKSSDLYMKCRYLDEITGGRGVVFATGTPISNSMVEMYTMQKYLQYSTLVNNNLIHFDSWASTFGETVTAIELAPEGNGYRAKTRFAKFYNLPELMSIFKEVADVKTADMLNLPVPKANYHNVALKPSEHQKQMVEDLSERAERVRNGMVDSSVDNMLCITNDGRKLALDQRLLNELLPDSETGKVSACADNVFDIWQRTAKDRSTQLVFCDLSTPKCDGKFNVYDDLKAKLVSKGIPESEIAFIHSANTETQKKEMFGKVRSGQIRVLIGSTQKMGAGTNVQKKLIALHHLDCPWRPADLQQREGRIIRQGNDNPEVDIYTYVTENTFDSYLYQLVEGKQKFIGQIMTSKSPVRSAEDVDEQALSYAEIKALCTGNPYIKEKMDLDIDVSRLKLLKANHLSQHYALEDRILKEIPQRMAALEQRIAGYKADIVRAQEDTHPNEDGFSPMIIKGETFTEKKAAGSEILALCKTMTNPEPITIGSYRGFEMELSFDTFSKEYRITLIGELRHTTSLGTDIFGNIQRLDNLISAFPEKQEACENQLENEKVQLENAKIELDKPFVHEKELKTKSARLAELNSLLDMDKKDNEIVDGEREESDKDEPDRSDDREER